MIPILYDKNETIFVSNGLGRLRDCISCVVTEERNGIYECDFEYPIDGVNYDRIQLGRIIAVEHDEKGDVQPFDIVSYSRPINGVVTFHAVHISYRQTALTVTGSNINSLADTFTLFASAEPENPFSYWTDMTSTGYLAAADSIPHSVRQMIGGMEGSVLDSYGGELEWDKWTVKLWASRGSLKNFTIRYGVNLTDYSDEMDYSDTYNSVIPYWRGQDSNGNDIVVKGDIQTASYPSFNGTGRCIPLDVTDKFDAENGQPTKAQVEAEGLMYINANQTYMPAQTIKVDFVRITDSPEYAQFAQLQKCGLCDSINVEFPQYGMTGKFKIVKTTYDVLQERYNTLELGGLTVTLSEALGINQESANRLRTGGGSGALNCYPVGSYYKTSDFTFDPSEFWGGTWSSVTSFDSGTLLYDNDNTSMSGQVTLSDSSANYDFFIVTCKTNDGHYISTAVHSPNGKKIDMTDAVVTTNNVHNIYLKSKTLYISGATINTDANGTSYYRTAQIQVNASSTTGSYSDYLNVTQVIGYKKIKAWHRTA